MPEQKITSEQPQEVINWEVGQEFRPQYPPTDKPKTYVIGRKPQTQSLRAQDMNEPGETLVRLSQDGQDVLESVSRRAIRLTLENKRMLIRNLGISTIGWWRNGLSQQVTVKPGETLAVPYSTDLRDATISLGHSNNDPEHGDYQLVATAVGGPSGQQRIQAFTLKT